MAPGPGSLGIARALGQEHKDPGDLSAEDAGDGGVDRFDAGNLETGLAQLIEKLPALDALHERASFRLHRVAVLLLLHQGSGIQIRAEM
jgi:hypothetical protein